MEAIELNVWGLRILALGSFVARWSGPLASHEDPQIVEAWSDTPDNKLRFCI